MMNADAIIRWGATRTFAIPKEETLTSTIRVIDANDPGSVLADVEPGMHVIGAALDRLGVIESVITNDAGVPVAITVSYGMLARKRKYVPGEFVDLVDEDRVVLSIDHAQFRMLRDIGE